MHKFANYLCTSSCLEYRLRRTYLYFTVIKDGVGGNLEKINFPFLIQNIKRDSTFVFHFLPKEQFLIALLVNRLVK